MLRASAFVFAWFLAVPNGYGAVILEYDLTGAAGNHSSQAAVNVHSGLVGNPLSRSIGLNAGGQSSNSFSSSGWESTDGPLNNEYFSFGFSINSGFAVDLQDFRVITRSSATGPRTMGLYSSVNGYGTALATITQTNGGEVQSTILLSSLQNLTGTIQFRIAEVGNTQASGSGATGATGTFRFQNFNGSTSVQLNGTVTAIPEPASAIVLSVLGITSLSLRRLRRKLSPQA